MSIPFALICLIYIIGLAFVFAELFIPGGIVGILGFIAMIGSIVTAFWYYPPVYGLSLTFITLIIVPILVIWYLRKISLPISQNVEDGYSISDESLEELIGKKGVTVTLLRPVGIAKIDNRRIDVTSENIAIEANTSIQVVKVEGNRVFVKQIK